MKTIQCLTVMMVMTVMVYTASIPPKPELMGQIHDEAINMSNNKTPEVYVTNIRRYDGTVCVHKFFCLAEKALKKANKREYTDKLIRLLEQFNNTTDPANCTLKGTGQLHLKSFLADIVKCTDNWRISHHISETT